MTGYRITSAGMAVSYLALSVSILVVPPTRRGDGTTVFDAVSASWTWAAFFVAAALGMIAASIFRPARVYSFHAFLFVVVLSFGTANLGTSILNSSGWIIASLCSALAFGHVLAFRRRPTVL